jgi:hypothetical protein
MPVKANENTLTSYSASEGRFERKMVSGIEDKL